MVTALRWEKTPVPGTMLTDPGVYSLRCNELSWDAERLWRTYMMLTDFEAVLRNRKGAVRQGRARAIKLSLNRTCAANKA